MYRRLSPLLALGLALACSDTASSNDAGAGGADAATNVGADAGTPSSAMIGPAGGELAVAGLKLVIPSGAVSSAQQLSVSIVSQTAPAGYEGYSPVYRFEPEGMTFTLPVRVTLDLRVGAMDPELFWTLPGSTTQYEPVAATVLGGQLVGLVDHFSQGFGGRLLPPATDAGAGEDAAVAAMDAGAQPDAAPLAADATAADPDAAAEDAAVASPDAGADDAATHPDAAAPDAAAGNADAAVMVCNALDPGTHPVVETVMHANFPAPTGGTIAPGTYVMVERVRYDGPGGSAMPGAGTFFQTLRFGATQYEQSFRLEAAGQVHTGQVLATWSTAATTFAIDISCPEVRTAMSPYSVVGNRFIQYAGATTGIASVFELQ